MIAEGQKLREGDYVKDLTTEQYRELLEIENPEHPDNEHDSNMCYSEKWNGFYFNGIELLFVSKGARHKTKYNFADFRQLCENTFNDKT